MCVDEHSKLTKLSFFLSFFFPPVPDALLVPKQRHADAHLRSTCNIFISQVSMQTKEEGEEAGRTEAQRRRE